MARNIIEEIRKDAISDIFGNRKFCSCWEIWKPLIKEKCDNCNYAKALLDIGDSLRDIFKTTRPGSGRGGQSEMSSAGTLWEAIILWYMNICLLGSRAVVIKKSSKLPKPIKDALTVYYDNLACSAEPDLTVMVFPKKDVFVGEPDLFLTPRARNIDNEKLSNEVAKYFELFQIGVIQCKSNWNENSQIPMLWDIIYNSGGIPAQHIMVGTETFNLKDLKRFTYSFVTMPSNGLNGYSSTRVEISRVRNLSGGNYWGVPTKNGVAKSVKEIFRLFDSAFSTSIKSTLTKELPKLGTEHSYFHLV